MDTVLFTIIGKTATSAAVAFTLGDAFLVGSLLTSIGGGLGAASARSDQAEADAILAQREAVRERAIGEREAENLERSRSAAFATNRALRGAFGTVDTTGTNLLKQEQFIEQTALDVETVRVGGLTKASVLESEAAISRQRGATAKRQGFVDVGTSLLTTAKKFSFV
jgi:hypothetical protein